MLLWNEDVPEPPTIITRLPALKLKIRKKEEAGGKKKVSKGALCVCGMSENEHNA